MPNNCIVTYNMHHTLFCPFFALPCAQVVTACVVLHNICIGVGDHLPPDNAALEDNQPPAADEGACGESESGAAWRVALANEVSALAGAPQDHDYCAQVNIMAQSPCHNLLILQ